jgi:hypothetical protein
MASAAIVAALWLAGAVMQHRLSVRSALLVEALAVGLHVAFAP